ncbi:MULTISPECIES: NAD(P)-dependent oxidoreductase [Bhargavaea]|uniref:NAD(P)-dependent oxidoreductase n=1 Tax=Bhargavaea changchunensis TaxID=2134037 RepID=A0ABW2NCM3_9BACL|nr:NAD(P)-dependent oxidoreductase [Bhargavaea sp. CC-171006]
MNRPDWLIIGSDARFPKAADHLRKKGYTVIHDARDTWDSKTDELLKNEKPVRVVLPIHPPEGQPAPGLLEKVDRLFVGRLNAEWEKATELAGKLPRLYLQEERFIWENAVLTAEGFLAMFYRSGAGPVAGRQWIVAGYGRVGKTTARLLRAMGAEVSVLARSPSQTAEALTEGFGILDFHEAGLPGGILVNTIPSQWLELSGQYNPSHIYDLASAPGCLKPGAAHEYYRLLPALPGRIFPDDAARILSEALCRMDS